MTTSYDRFHAELETLELNDQARTLKQTTAKNGKFIYYRGTPCLNLSSNDYLGLAVNRKFTSRFYETLNDDTLINQFGLSASSSRLLTGNSALYEELEAAISKLYDHRPALVFNSGYHANIGIIPALAREKDLILSDSLNHASIVDGIRLSRADCMIFRHNDMEHLSHLLKTCRHRYETVLIITESIFSMDGDLTDIRTLVELKEAFDALLYIDEAHSVGVYGSCGQGLCHELHCQGQIDILLGPMGKALASHGAYAVTHPIVKSLLLNRMRSLLYSTALPPVAVNWTLFVISQLSLLSKQRQRLSRVSGLFRQALQKKGIETIGNSHIIPVLTYGNKAAVELSRHLINKGFLVFPIRPPTVPENNSRLRFSLTSDMKFEDLAPVADMINHYINKVTNDN